VVHVDLDGGGGGERDALAGGGHGKLRGLEEGLALGEGPPRQRGLGMRVAVADVADGASGAPVLRAQVSGYA
jgi:hypothetical protein